MERNGQMKKNMGTLDRVIRAIVGLVLIYLAFTAGWGTLGTAVAAIVGIVLLVTAAMSNCPAYSILGVKTCDSGK
ncbi:DUF2892 domain-containing protein [Tropicimonas sp.]|uniref:YgaP family membrane protein n=1 Tax=Tropicimonas sp. TaxID=2067044 RepID=UPI003A85F025